MSWDLVARENFTVIDDASVAATLGRGPGIRRVTRLGYMYGLLNGTRLPSAQISSVTGDARPPITEGRAPRTSSEILVGRAALDALGLHVGDHAELILVADFSLGPRPQPKPMTVTVVGSAVAPAAGQAGIGTPRLGRGFVASAGTVDAVLGQDGVLPYIYMSDLVRGSDPQAIVDRFPEGLPDSSDLPREWFTSAVPAEVRQAEDARPVIWLGVGSLAMAVVGTIGHTLIGSVRRRRRDYAVLKALGFTPGQVRATVPCQTGAVLGVALVAAVPIGVAVGRWLRIAFAEDLGILVRPVVPVLLLAAAVVVTVLSVEVTGLLPATLARRTPPGRALRAQ